MALRLRCSGIAGRHLTYIPLSHLPYATRARWQNPAPSLLRHYRCMPATPRRRTVHRLSLHGQTRTIDGLRTRRYTMHPRHCQTRRSRWHWHLAPVTHFTSPLLLSLMLPAPPMRRIPHLLNDTPTIRLKAASLRAFISLRRSAHTTTSTARKTRTWRFSYVGCTFLTTAVQWDLRPTHGCTWRIMRTP